MEKKILFINMDFPPTGGPGVQRVLKFMRYFSEKQWNVTIISTENDTAINDFSLCDQVPTTALVNRIKWNKIDALSRNIACFLALLVFPLRILGFSKQSTIDGLSWRIYSWFIKIYPEYDASWVMRGFGKALQLYRKKKFDIIFTSGPPHSTHLIGALLKLFTGIKWIADFRDPWSDNFDCNGSSGVAGFLAAFKERFVIYMADIVITVSETWQKIFQNKLSCYTNSKVRVIYNGYDPNDLPEFSEKRLPFDGIHFHHNGTLYPRRDCTYLFKALGKLKLEKPDIYTMIHCTFTGISEHHNKLAQEIGVIDAIKNIGRFSHKDSLRYSYFVDVLLLMSDKADGPSHGAMTGKVYEYIALGKPILALLPRGGELDKFLSKYKYVETVEYDDVVGIANVFERIALNKKNRVLVFSDPPEWICEYSRSSQAHKLLEIIDEMVIK